ncbi:uncharacterized protein LOC135563113 [Oncorhynchus nerka]|uniref:uncharacterized protein LOC135563113 n=1 Tax=Oncorhynchus nerka TaxID=8023 RepID=UPI0031B83C65
MEESECPLSVWNVIVEQVPAPELPDIRGLFGDALIDMYTEIHTECGELHLGRHKLNVTHIDDVVAHLKSVLTEECEVLKSQVHFLQESVEQEHRTQCDVTEAPEPTVTELKEERRAIQLDLKKQSLSLTYCPSSPVETSLQSRSGSIGWTGLSADETQRHLTPVVAPRLHPPHTRPSPPLVVHLVRRTPSLDRMRGQPCSSPNTRVSSPLQPSEHKHPRTHSQSSEASHPCNREPITTAQARDSYLPPLGPSASTVTTHGSYLNPGSEQRIRGRTCRPSGQPVTVRAQRHDDSWSDSVNSWPLLFPGGHSPLGTSTQPPGSKGSCEQMSPVSMFHPVPPAVQRPASRGPSGARHLCLPQQGYSLVSSL